MEATFPPTHDEPMEAVDQPEIAGPTDRPQRATLRLIEPELQLRLPGYLFAITLGFAVLATLHGWYAYHTLLSGADASESYRLLLGQQTMAFLGVSFVLLLAYGCAMVGICVAYLRRVVGPIVAFRRQVFALRRGNYSARNSMRDGDPFADLGRDLNDLAQALEVRREMRLLNH